MAPMGMPNQMAGGMGQMAGGMGQMGGGMGGQFPMGQNQPFGQM
jgi:X-X-X-Leu-X-X-Gly heptad repeat protein